MNDGSYLTLAQNGTAEFMERKSRFIGYASPAAGEDEAVAFLQTIGTRHADASHNVYAYRLRRNGTQRFSDAGKPRGTAGLPILGVLEKHGLTDCAVVVTRYFGGTLLGTGGLARAYSRVALLAVEAAGIVRAVLCHSMEVLCSYADYDRLLYALSAVGAAVDDTRFGEQVSMIVHAPAGKAVAVAAAVADATGGVGVCRSLGTVDARE